MKIVVMSDTHLQEVDEAFEALCARYCRNADLVVHLGDYAGCCILDYLERYPLAAVAGNTDDWAIRSRLPARQVIRAGNRRIGITHGVGAGADPRAKLLGQFGDVDAILFGHTHQPLRIQEGGIFWFNPGSVFMGRGGSPRSLGILHVEDRIRGEIIPL